MFTQEILKKLRQEKKLSARQLSKIFEMEESTISEIERGKRNLTIETLKKYCNFFQQPSDYILGLKNRIPNISYENEEIILYNSILYCDPQFYDIYYKCKIKFKKNNWDKINISYKIEFTYEKDKNIYIPFEEKGIINYKNNRYIKNDEELIFIIIDNKIFNEIHNCNFSEYQIKNLHINILEVHN